MLCYSFSLPCYLQNLGIIKTKYCKLYMFFNSNILFCRTSQQFRYLVSFSHQVIFEFLSSSASRNFSSNLDIVFGSSYFDTMLVFAISNFCSKNGLVEKFQEWLPLIILYWHFELHSGSSLGSNHLSWRWTWVWFETSIWNY